MARKVKMENMGERWRLATPDAKPGCFAFVQDKDIAQGDPIGVEIVGTHRDAATGYMRAHFVAFQAYKDAMPDYDGPIWQWNGNRVEPTIGPSVLQEYPASGERAHFIISEGYMNLCDDHKEN